MKHSHYTKDVGHLSAIDVYRILSLFGVTDHAIGHAIKKLLCPGLRGVKTKRQDIQEAIDTLERWKAMEDEDFAAKYGGRTKDASVDHVSLVSRAPDPACKVIEPAAAIDDESPRMQAIGQNGNGGEHYYQNTKPILAMATGLSTEQLACMIDSLTLGAPVDFIATKVFGDTVELTQVVRVATP